MSRTLPHASGPTDPPLMPEFGCATGDDAAAWLHGYRQRSQAVAGDLGALFQRALAREVPDEIGTFRRDTASIRFLRRQRGRLAHRVLLFVYASRFDPAFADQVLPAGSGARPLFERKSAGLDAAFATLVRTADTTAGHYVAALMASPRWNHLPLVWHVPAEDPATTGFPRDAMWWLTFQYLCEISRAIVAYAGVTPLMLEELRHIHANRRLSRRLLLLDGDGRLYFADRDETTWPLAELPRLLAHIDARRRGPPPTA